MDFFLFCLKLVRNLTFHYIKKLFYAASLTLSNWSWKGKVNVWKKSSHSITVLEKKISKIMFIKNLAVIFCRDSLQQLSMDCIDFEILISSSLSLTAIFKFKPHMCPGFQMYPTLSDLCFSNTQVRVLNPC